MRDVKRQTPESADVREKQTRESNMPKRPLLALYKISWMTPTNTNEQKLYCCRKWKFYVITVILGMSTLLLSLFVALEKVLWPRILYFRLEGYIFSFFSWIMYGIPSGRADHGGFIKTTLGKRIGPFSRATKCKNAETFRPSYLLTESEFWTRT